MFVYSVVVTVGSKTFPPLETKFSYVVDFDLYSSTVTYHSVSVMCVKTSFHLVPISGFSCTMEKSYTLCCHLLRTSVVIKMRNFFLPGSVTLCKGFVNSVLSSSLLLPSPDYSSC